MGLWKKIMSIEKLTEERKTPSKFKIRKKLSRTRPYEDNLPRPAGAWEGRRRNTQNNRASLKSIDCIRELDLVTVMAPIKNGIILAPINWSQISPHFYSYYTHIDMLKLEQEWIWPIECHSCLFLYRRLWYFLASWSQWVLPVWNANRGVTQSSSHAQTTELSDCRNERKAIREHGSKWEHVRTYDRIDSCLLRWQWGVGGGGGIYTCQWRKTDYQYGWAGSANSIFFLAHFFCSASYSSYKLTNQIPQ